MITLGARVKKSDIRPDSIPAYKALRGRVVWVSPDGKDCKVSWGSGDSDVYSRKTETITLAESEES